MKTWLKFLLAWNMVALVLVVVAGRGMFGFAEGPLLYAMLVCLSVAFCLLGLRRTRFLPLGFWWNVGVFLTRPVLGFLASFTFAPGDDAHGLRWLFLSVAVGVGDFVIGISAAIWAIICFVLRQSKPPSTG